MFSNRMVRYAIYIIVISMLVLVAASCGILGSDDDDSVELVDGLSPAIWEMVDEELISTFEDGLDVPIHRGANPPDLLAALSGEPKKRLASGEVTVVMRPFVLFKTLVPDDQCEDKGCNYSDLYIRLDALDYETHEVTTTMGNIGKPEITSTSGLISGEGDSFSIFVEEEQDYDGDILQSVSLFSGKVTSEGIEEPHLATVMIDNAGVESMIPNGTGYSFVDGEGFAEIIEWPEGEAQKVMGNEAAKVLNHIWISTDNLNSSGF
ncbi:MAG: hypothetical protein R6V27_06110 [Balneolaceae bacterium]